MPYRRSIFLINKRFQFRFSFYVVSWLAVISLIYPLIIYNLFDYFVRFASLNPEAPSTAALAETRSEVIQLLVLLQLIFLGVTFLISIFVSHRIAGPLYKLKQALIAGQKNPKSLQEVHFRKSDHFKDLAEEYNKFIQAVSTGKPVSSSEPKQT